MIKHKLAYFVSHPIQYQAPLLRRLALEDSITLKVFFLSSLSATAYMDPGFKQIVHWDIPVTSGYDFEYISGEGYKEVPSWLHPTSMRIGRILEDEDWTAVWFHGFANISLVWGLLSAIRLKIPILFRGESTLTCSQKGVIKDKLMRWLVEKVSAFLWVGSDNRDYYRYYGAGEEKLFFVPYAVDNEFFQEHSETAEQGKAGLKCELGLEEDLPIVLYASKLIRRKNPHVLLSAFMEICEEGPASIPAYLLFVGDGEERPELERMARDKGLQKYVRFLGFKNQTELPRFYNLCDLFVLASSKEPFGLAVNEVMNAGRAIISTDEVGASRDLVKDGINGYIVPAGDKDSLKERLDISLRNRKQMQLMGEESKRIIARWSYEEDIAGILQALKIIS